VGFQDIGIVGVNQGILKAFLKKEVGVTHKILVEGIIQPDKESERFFPAAATSARLLPGTGDATRITGEHRCVQTSDINSQKRWLER
jgi:hypothetical protein